MATRDTTHEAREAQLAAWRRLGPAGRVELAWELAECARETSLAGILARNPALSREEGRLLLIRRLLGDDLFTAAFRTAKPTP
jgi:hypothetical protein